jgi:lactobin A/cerein 7B family class IIb bacteriocin
MNVHEPNETRGVRKLEAAELEEVTGGAGPLIVAAVIGFTVLVSDPDQVGAAISFDKVKEWAQQQGK